MPVSQFEIPVAKVLEAAKSPITRAMYRKAFEDFLYWLSDTPNSGLDEVSVLAHKEWLVQRKYAPSTVNLRLSAIRRLATQAAELGIIPREELSGIMRIKGQRAACNQPGNVLTQEQAEMLLNLPDEAETKGKRDRAILALMVGCGLKRREIVQLLRSDIQRMAPDSVIANVESAGRSRTVRIPSWAVVPLDVWLTTLSERSERVFVSVNRHAQITSRTISEQALRNIVREYGNKIGLRVRPNDLRRTCAKLCRSTGSELEDIQLLLGHSSVQVTENFLGRRPVASGSPNDRIVFHFYQKHSVAS
jgi:site-specific recombinase XerD